ncbi:protein phosphatase CheZ [Actimicrobium antarcticum]|uniref:Protein phosphatase CheZ n=1 Tax=Actimicrobium antarcticum TaxID=1051899 RepID=A0ABP7TPW2_9BURK
MNTAIEAQSRNLPRELVLPAAGSALPVYERLGMIVRALHDTLSELGAEDVLADAASEFPSARERLLHIANLTENAANIVLLKVEENIPVQEQLVGGAATLSQSWSAVASTAGMTVEQEQLAESTRRFLLQVQGNCGGTRAALSDIMMAQDFQDLTGQLINKVVALMERTENDLLKLLIDAAPAGTVVQIQRNEVTAGPGAPGSIALDQGSVDDLLADLGF